MADYKYIVYETGERLATITLNRPDKRNALNYPLIRELKEALAEAEADSEVKAVILRGSGDAFCAGADLEYLERLQDYGFAENLADSTHLMELFLKIHHLKKVVIAQIEGHALAGGAGLATVADFSFAVPEAKFGYTEVKIGFVPALVMVFLLRKIGEAKARELLLTGDAITAEEAQRAGLVNYIVPKEEIAARVRDFALRLCRQNSGGSMELVKRMIADVQTLPLAEALQFAARMNAHARATEECRRGIRAFLAKEKLEW